MSKKKIILMSNIFLLLIFICSSFTSANAASREWQPGDLYLFGFRQHQKAVTTNTENGGSDAIEILLAADYSYNITKLDLIAGFVEFIQKDSGGGSSLIANPFLMKDFTSMYISTSDVFTIVYSWDFEHNRTLLTDFSVSLPNWLLIEPDWPTLMHAMLDTLNESAIIYQLADPYLPIIHNFTFSQFLNSIPDFSINGKDTLAKAKSKGIKDDTSTYELIFDLSDVIYTGTYNATLGYNQYYPFTVFKYATVMEYSEGGILNYYKRELEYDYTVGIYNQDFYFNYEIILGGSQAFNANFALIAVVPAIITVAIGAKIANKRRRKR